MLKNIIKNRKGTRAGSLPQINLIILFFRSAFFLHHRSAIVFGLCGIMRVKQLMRTVRIRFAEIFIVKRFKLNVFVRFTLCLTGILAVKSSGAERFKVDIGTRCRIDDRGTAAGHAAAGAAHDLDEGIILFTALDHIEQLLGVAGPVGDGYAHLGAVEVDGGFLYAGSAAHGGEVDIIERFAGDGFINRAESGFHNAAGGAEDDACAGGFAEYAVEILIREAVEIDAGVFDHARKLADGKNRIDIGKAVVGKLFTFCFVLFGGAGHHRNDIDILRVDTRLFGIIALDDRAEHLVRGFAGGKVIEKFGIKFLAILDPAGRAGGDHRQLAAVFEAVQKLRALLENGEIGAEIGIEHLVEPKPSKSGNELAGNACTDGHAEFLAERGADSGCGLNNNVL